MSSFLRTQSPAVLWRYRVIRGSDELERFWEPSVPVDACILITASTAGMDRSLGQDFSCRTCPKWHTSRALERSQKWVVRFARLFCSDPRRSGKWGCCPVLASNKRRLGKESLAPWCAVPCLAPWPHWVERCVVYFYSSPCRFPLPTEGQSSLPFSYLQWCPVLTSSLVWCWGLVLFTRWKSGPVSPVLLPSVGWEFRATENSAPIVYGPPGLGCGDEASDVHTDEEGGKTPSEMGC